MRLRMTSTDDKIIAAALDAGLDDLTTGSSRQPSTQPDEVVALLATARRLESTEVGVSTSQVGSSQTWSDIVRQAEGHVPAPRRTAARPGWDWSGRLPRFGELVTASVVGAVILAGVFGTSLIERGRKEAAGPTEAQAMYLASYNSATLQPIDPITLVDLPGEYPVLSATPAPGSETEYTVWSMSADGSTLASRTSQDGDGPIHIYDSASGRLKREIDTVSGTPILSRDGSTLVVQGAGFSNDEGQFRLPTQWVSYDVATGERLAYIEATGARRVAFTNVLFEAQSDRMHVLSFTDAWDMRSSEPSDLRILTYDLRLGTLVQERSLADLDLGVGLSDYSGQIRSAVGWDISPDGSIIAMMPANHSGIRLIETSDMTLSRDPINLEPIVSTSTPFSVSGECTQSQQTSGIVFAPDGHSVYVTWLDYACINGTAVEYRSAGIRAIDIESRTEQRSATIDGWYVLTQQTGTASIYAVHVQLPDSDDFTPMGDIKITMSLETSLIRLDAASLTVEAERPLDDDFMLALIVPQSS